MTRADKKRNSNCDFISRNTPAFKISNFLLATFCPRICKFLLITACVFFHSFQVFAFIFALHMMKSIKRRNEVKRQQTHVHSYVNNSNTIYPVYSWYFFILPGVFNTEPDARKINIIIKTFIFWTVLLSFFFFYRLSISISYCHPLSQVYLSFRI